MVTAENKLNSENSVVSAKIFVLICVCLFNFQQLVNAACISLDGNLGECVRFEECRSAVILSRKGITPGFCSLAERIVCCTDTRNTAREEKRPYTEPQSNYNQRRPSSSEPAYTNAKDEDFQRKKYNTVKPSGNGNYGKKKNNFDANEDPYGPETPGTFYSYDAEGTSKPARRPSRPSSQNQESNFVPPGQSKKKSWRDEKTTENDYYYEHVTKKPSRGPNRKNSNKHTGNSNESSGTRKCGEVDPEWGDQGRKTSTGSSYNSQNEYENDYSYKRTTQRPNNWEQGDYFSTRRPDHYGNRPDNNYFGNEDAYQGSKPTRRPQPPPSNSNFNTNRPNSQKPPSQGNNNFPKYPQGSSTANNRPTSRPDTQRRKSISEQKCEEYSKQVIENITGLPLTTNPDPVTIPVRKCITPQQLIVGGENTTLGEFPHMAAIGFRDRNKKISWNCGGTLISDQFVMTAGHCTSTSSGKPVKVRLGEYNLMKNDDGAYPVDYAVVEIITHPDYKPPSKYNDIALLRLSRKVTFFKHIRPACLYLEDTFSATKAIATGWGRITYDGGSSEILQKVVLSIVDNRVCDRLYKINVKTEVLSRGIVESQLCAGELTGGKDTCQGDSGGPLSITSTKCIHHIIGITSFGKSCALPNSTGVYTRVSSYIPWIESVVWPSTDY